MSQITTSTFFKVDTFSNKWWAFTQMQLGHRELKNVAGLTFYKLLGSGAKNGFSAVPNFGTYVLFCIWESESHAETFFKKTLFFNHIKNEVMSILLSSSIQPRHMAFGMAYNRFIKMQN